MKLWRENFALKALAFIIAVAAFATTAVMGCYQLINFDVLWSDGAPEDSYSIRYLEWQDLQSITALMGMYSDRELGQALSVSVQQAMAELEERFDAARTNLRWQALDREGGIRWGNTREEIPLRAQGLYQTSWSGGESTVHVDWEEMDWASTVEGAVNVADPENVIYTLEDVDQILEIAAWNYQNGTAVFDEAALDTVYLSPQGTANLLVVRDSAGVHVYGPSVRNATTVNEYGYQYQEGEWLQIEDHSGEWQERLDVLLWLADGLPVADRYQQLYTAIEGRRANRELLLALAILCALAGLALTVCLCVGAGHKRGVDGISLNWLHRIPGDLLLAGFVMGVAVLFEAASSYYRGMYEPVPWQLVLAGTIIAITAAMGMGMLITFAARCKARTIWRNTVIWRLCRLAWRLCRRGWQACGRLSDTLPLIWKAALAGLGYLLLSLLALTAMHNGGWYYGGGRGIVWLWILATGGLLAYLCLWAYQWKCIRQGTREIVGGNPDYHIDAQYMLPDLKRHAGELNNLGQSIAAAVEERMQSERFKAELITNVSHDLKTPLTSIINYVDLLKKERIENPRAAEYIEVLDRKSQRLKKLTEDLVEASKASTGSLTVVPERLDLGQLLDQAVAEYLERLEEKRLTVVRTLPEEPVWVKADGRYLWRVIDNLLSNCAKYTLEGTRIYISLQRYSDCAQLSVKNISREALNIPAEQLMERFVRGEESRTTEGSGLGLSIAQSLTELQQGRFDISVDGDLFKANVTLPLAGE